MKKKTRSGHLYHVKYNVRERAIYLRGEIKPCTAFLIDRAVKAILQDCRCGQKFIFFFIDSPGGDFDATMAIWQTFAPLSDQLVTIAHHRAYSGGILLLELGKLRLATVATTFLIHSACVEVPWKNSYLNSAESLEIFNQSSILNYDQFKILTMHGGIASQILPMFSSKNDTIFGVRKAIQLKLLDGVIKTNKLSKIKKSAFRKLGTLKDA